MKDRGFTLIELLVVIAILSILAAIILASLNSARDRSRTAAIKAEIHEVQNEAEIFYATHNSYIDDNSNPEITVCDHMDRFRNKVFDLMSNNQYPFANCIVTQSGNGYATEVALGDNEYWCVDSNDFDGYSAPEDPAPSGPLSNYDWSGDRICDGDISCGTHTRTTCVPAS